MTLSSSRNPAKAALLCKWIQSLLKRIPRFIWAILRRLFYRWGFKDGLWDFSHTSDEKKKIERPPQRRSRLPSGEIPRGYPVFDAGKSSLDTLSTNEGSPFVPDLSYTILYDDETISLDNVLCSAFPFTGGSIRNASQSSVNLKKSRKAHKQHVAGTSKSSLYTNSSQGSSARQTTQSPTSRWLNKSHISPAIPVATQRYSDRPTM